MFDLHGDGTDFIDHETIRRIRDVASNTGIDTCVVVFYGKKNDDVYLQEVASSVAERLAKYRAGDRQVYLGRGKGTEVVERSSTGRLPNRVK